MAMTIKQLLNFSWMSQASYLDFTGFNTTTPAGAIQNQLQNTSQINPDKIFSPTQATAFTDPTSGFSFINYAPNDASGFSATVFKSNGATNDYTIAVRGTEPTWGNLLSDLGNADVLGVALKGAAYEQTISAYRYYKQQTTANGRQVSYSTAELAKLGAMYNETLLSLPTPILDAAVRTVRVSQFLATFTDVANPNNWGVGAIDATTANIHFTGHSLGGHVATLLASMVQQFGQGSVADVTTYNAPGQGGLFGVNPLIDATQVAAKITNIIGEGGMTVTPNVGNAAGAIGQLFIEVNSSNPIDNHSIVKLSDSLAVYNLFATLAPTLNSNPTSGIQTITNILKASSNVAANTLESAVSALGKLFLVNGAAGFNGNEFDSGVTGRDLLYTALNDITAALPAGGFTLRDLSAYNAAQIASVAQNNLAYRYALVTGNPFALVGNDAIYTAHNTGGTLDLFDTTTGQGTLTSQYLADRSDYLTKLLVRNAQDSTASRLSSGGGDTLYRDIGTGAVTEFRTGSLLAADDARKHFEFGSGQGETMLGGAMGDHLYGMDGNDIIYVGAGGLFGREKCEAANDETTQVWRIAA